MATYCENGIVPTRWEDDLRDYGPPSKYRQKDNVRYALTMRYHQKLWECPAIPQPHVHEVLLIYRKRTYRRYDMQTRQWVACDTNQGDGWWHWDGIVTKHFGCHELREAMAEFEAFRTLDLDVLRTQEIL